MKFLKKTLIAILFFSNVCFQIQCGKSSNNPQDLPNSLNILSSLSDHPRILISSEQLEKLKEKANRNDASWITLKRKCDSLVEEQNTKEAKIGVWDESHELYSLGLCYQLIRTSHPEQAEKYANRGKQYLSFLANDDLNPLWNKGYAIRFRVVGMAIGYDWLYPSLDSNLKTQVHQAIHRWIEAMHYDWEWNQGAPQGNYYAGYYAAKGLAALSLYGDDPEAVKIWNEFYQKDHLTNVQPYYSKYLSGGGWPEGWNYGPLGTYNMTLPVYAVKTGSKKDLIRDQNHPFLFPLEQAKNLIHFSWPTLLSLEDRGTVGPGDNPTENPVYLLNFLSSVLKEWKDDFAPIFHSYVRAVRKENKNRSQPWQEFLFWDEEGADKDYKTLQTSYFAPGMNSVAMRSSWEKNAVWGSFTSGQYINNSWSGEQYYDQGSLSIRRGETAFLVNAIGTLMRNTPGLIDENGNPIEDGKSSIKKTENGKEITYPLSQAIYDNLYQAPYQRDLFNIFLIGSPRLGQIATPLEISNTHISRFEDGEKYVAITGTQLEDMYRVTQEQTRLMTHWTREINYLRPDNLFLVFDRTQVADPTLKQWINFHIASDSKIDQSSNGLGIYKFSKQNNFVGKVITVLPENREETFENLFGEFGIQKVNRLKINSNDNQSNHVWLTIFDASIEANSITRTEKIVSDHSNISAIFLQNPARNLVIIFSNDFSEKPLDHSIHLTLPSTDPIVLMVNDLIPNSQYEIRRESRELQISPVKGGRFQSSQQGVLYLENL